MVASSIRMWVFDILEMFVNKKQELQPLYYPSTKLFTSEGTTQKGIVWLLKRGGCINQSRNRTCCIKAKR